MGVMSVRTHVRPDDLAVVAEARGYALVMDQSKKNGGREDTMKPMEVVLAALGGCISMVARGQAPLKGIDLQDIALAIDGDARGDVDFRLRMRSAGSRAVGIPDDVAAGLRRLMDHLGLVYGVQLDDQANATIDMTLTSPTCPLTDKIEYDTKYVLDGLVNSVTINWVWLPPWGPERITPEGREMLQALGFNV